MKKKNIKKIPVSILLVLLLLLVAVLSFIIFSQYSLIKKDSSNNMVSVDRPDYYPSDAAVPYLTLKWLNNIKYAKKGILSTANIQTMNEGRITLISFKQGKINVDKKADINYPFVVRIELKNQVQGTKETLFFSKIRYEKAQIFRTEKNGLVKKTNWNDIKVGDSARIEESINLLISNVDSQNNFTDKYLKSLIIYLK